MSKKTLVLGGSLNPARYSNMAIHRLRTHGIDTVAIGLRPGKVADVDILTGMPPLEDVDTITLYMNELRQREYYHYIKSLNPKRIIFNPGAENDELAEIARKEGWEALEACTLVMLGTGQY